MFLVLFDRALREGRQYYEAAEKAPSDARKQRAFEDWGNLVMTFRFRKMILSIFGTNTLTGKNLQQAEEYLTQKFGMDPQNISRRKNKNLPADTRTCQGDRKLPTGDHCATTLKGIV